MLNARELIPTHEVLLVTLDTLRYDVVCDALEAGSTPCHASVLPGGAWELRHTPASFTYAAHHAFFAGFLPTPASPGTHPRLFAARFAGSETTTERPVCWMRQILLLAWRDWAITPSALVVLVFSTKQRRWAACCRNCLPRVTGRHVFSVTDDQSTENQVALAVLILQSLPRDKRVFLFLNVSTLHQPNCIFMPGAREDSKDS